ncbi:MAG: DUF6305 family protein [Melioribacteraceae bacterium]|nr:DUF6305 family protein [Melioribacteraceae bacterium]
MKQILLMVTMILIFGITIVNAQSETTNKFKAEDPVLITSSGQSADILMVKILCKKASLEYELNKSATPDILSNFKSVIIVPGGSTKGLGAAKIDKEEEYARTKKIIEKAKKEGIKIIAVHVGGKSRRGALSDYFNKLVAENADHIIVVSGGNQDNYFTNIAKEQEIEIDTTEKIVLITDVLKRIYSKE